MYTKFFSELTGFCGRYDRKHFDVLFFGLQCRLIAVVAVGTRTVGEVIPLIFDTGCQFIHLLI